MIGIKTSIKQIVETFQEERALFEGLRNLDTLEVYVGIPEENNDREEEEIGNAQLLYYHTHGSPLTNLPKRPLIEPALAEKENAAKISADIAKIVTLLLDSEKTKAKMNAERLGQRAVMMVNKWFKDPRNNWEPNKPATVLAKLKKTNLSKKKIREMYGRFLEGEYGIDTPLIDTGEMRHSITYTVVEKK